MLGRRQLRAKAMQALYAYYRGNHDMRLVENNMLKGIRDVEDLYFVLLTLLIAVRDEAEKKIEVGLAKNFPTEEEKKPNRKFIHNPIFDILESKEDLKDFSERNKQLNWTVEGIYPSKILKAFTEGKTYKSYLKSEENSFEDHKRIVLHLFINYIAGNEEVESFLEDYNINWADDLHIANTMVVNTLKTFKEDGLNNLFTLLLDEEHLEFTKNLLKKAINNEQELVALIDEKAQNWDFERIALIDRLILQMALTEFLYFPSIPPKVTINEYVEMSKSYSTPKSKTFVNGILDKTLKDLQEEGKIRKSARGMM
ncbi:transcription antitermination factor NusB [Flavobacteriaceae bacterium Ap0902]|nr:transcription antitermination factor NusB [Flavobacteriaceae bacterium Ap0902]